MMLPLTALMQDDADVGHDDDDDGDDNVNENGDDNDENDEYGAKKENDDETLQFLAPLGALAGLDF